MATAYFLVVGLVFTSFFASGFVGQILSMNTSLRMEDEWREDWRRVESLSREIEELRERAVIAGVASEVSPGPPQWDGASAPSVSAPGIDSDPQASIRYEPIGDTGLQYSWCSKGCDTRRRQVKYPLAGVLAGATLLSTLWPHAGVLAGGSVLLWPDGEWQTECVAVCMGWAPPTEPDFTP